MAEPTGNNQNRVFASSFHAERDFGRIVGGVFTLLGTWWLYRDKFHVFAPIAIVGGLILLLLSVVRPAWLKWPNRGWMKLADVMSMIMTTVVLAIVFFVVMAPIGFVLRRTGWDPLRRRSQKSHSHWRAYSERQQDKAHYEKMW